MILCFSTPPPQLQRMLTGKLIKQKWSMYVCFMMNITLNVLPTTHCHNCSRFKNFIKFHPRLRQTRGPIYKIS